MSTITNGKLKVEYERALLQEARRRLTRLTFCVEVAKIASALKDK